MASRVCRVEAERDLQFGVLCGLLVDNANNQEGRLASCAENRSFAATNGRLARFRIVADLTTTALLADDCTCEPRRSKTTRATQITYCGMNGIEGW
jgi:hypothetical protein